MGKKSSRYKLLNKFYGVQRGKNPVVNIIFHPFLE